MIRRSVGIAAIVGALAVTLAGPASASSRSPAAARRAPAASGFVLSAVSCGSGTSCTAAGSYITSANADVTLAEHWNGHSWTILHPITSAGSIGVLRGVSCTSARACTAVGSDDSGSLDQTLAERWNGQKWEVQHTPNPASPQNFLTGVSCSSARACMATGAQGTAGSTIGLAMHWNGRKWAVQPSAAPAGGSDVMLPSVACWSATACMAVGEYFIGSDIAQALSVLRIPGTGWSIQHAPHGTAIDSELNGVSCSSARICTTVGNYSSGHLLAWRWHGGNDGTWAIEHVPHP
jgi:hypothetical protein